MLHRDKYQEIPSILSLLSSSRAVTDKCRHWPSLITVLVQQKFLYSKSSCTAKVLVQQKFLYSNSSCTATVLVQQQFLYSNSSCTATVQHYIHPLMYFNKVMMSEHYTVTMVKLTFKHCFFHRICSAFEQIFTFKLK